MLKVYLTVLRFQNNILFMKYTKKDFRDDFGGGIILAGLFLALLFLSPIMVNPVAFTGSMEPNLKGGDILIIDESVDESDLEVGDIIKYESQAISPGDSIVHRITADFDGFETRGDNRYATDQQLPNSEPRITNDNLEGKVIYVIPTSRLLPF